MTNNWNLNLSKKQSTGPNRIPYLPRVEYIVPHNLGFAGTNMHIVHVRLTCLSIQKDLIFKQKWWHRYRRRKRLDSDMMVLCLGKAAIWIGFFYNRAPRPRLTTCFFWTAYFHNGQQMAAIIIMAKIKHHSNRCHHYRFMVYVKANTSIPESLKRS